MPELPTKARLPILTSLHPQPATAQLVAADQRVVGQEGPSLTVVRVGISRTVEASTSVPDPGAEQAQPRGCHVLA